MAIEHHCTDGTWQAGPVAKCPKHKKLDGRRANVWSPKERRKMDREAGTIGQDRGGYING